MRFKKGDPNVRRITAKQADAIRVKAHKLKMPSMALAQALQFDLKLSQREVAGEWVPLSEPGSSDIVKGDWKWLGGLRWSQIDANLVLRHTVNGKEIAIDLKRAAMVMAELNRLGEIPKGGPMIIFESTGLPYEAAQFRRKWRTIATVADVPKSVRNVRYQGRGNDTASVTKKDGPAKGKVLIDDNKISERISAVCKTLPDNIREDVAQEMAVDVLDGKIALDQLRESRPEYVKRIHKAYDNQFNTQSLDRPLRGRRNSTFGDTISADHEIWK
jgi:hypothetical protein